MIPEHIIEKLHKAIDEAEGPGSCSYIGPDAPRPYCVAAKFCSSMGVPLEALKKWEGDEVHMTLGINGVDLLAIPATAELTRGQHYLLASLQRSWDTVETGAPHEDVRERREYMHKTVDNAQYKEEASLLAAHGEFAPFGFEDWESREI
jgi:hypothetical protein